MQIQSAVPLVRAHGHRFVVHPCLWLFILCVSWTPRAAWAQNTTNPCETVLVFGTGTSAGGLKLRGGSVDPFFDGVSANFLNAPNAYVVTNPAAAWLANSASADSQWIGPSVNTLDDAAGTDVYRLQFTTPCARATVSGRYLAGDRGALRLNGAAVSFPTPAVGYSNWTAFSFNNLPAGANTLEFYVTNAPTFVGAPGPTGLRAELTVTATCCACIELNCPTDLFLTTCSNGATANFTLSGTNRCSTNLTINCFVAAGTGAPITTNTVFPPGTNTVVCTGTDSVGHSTNCSFRVVVVRDSQPPQIHCPGDIVYLCNSAGTNVYFNVTATDDVDPAPSVVCVPPSGSVFPIGTTPVACIATDRCGRQSRCGFPIVISSTNFTKIIQAGVADNFSPGAFEPANPGLCLPATGLWTGMPFDTSWPGRTFAHTFVGLPLNISSARLTIVMKPTQPASQDDILRVGLLNCGGPAAWAFTAPVASLPGASGTWNVNPATTFTFDLAALPNGANLLANLNASHRLEFAVGTETLVDFARLEVQYCGPQSTLSGVPYSLQNGLSTHLGDGISWRLVNSNTPLQIELDAGLAEGIRLDFDLSSLFCPGIGQHHGLSTVWPTGEGTTATLGINAAATAGQTRVSMSQPSNTSGKAVEVWNAGQLVSRYYLSGAGDTAVQVPSPACLFQMGFAGQGYFFANFRDPVPVNIVAGGQHISGQVGPLVTGDTIRLYYVTTVSATEPKYPVVTLNSNALTLSGISLQHLGDWISGRGPQQLSVSDAVISSALLNSLLHPYGDCSPAFGPWNLALNGVVGFCTSNGTNPPVCNNGFVDVNLTAAGNGGTILNFGGLRLTPTSLPLDACTIQNTIANSTANSITVNRAVGGPITINGATSLGADAWPTSVSGNAGPQALTVTFPPNTTVSVNGQLYVATQATFSAQPQFLGEFYQVCLETTLQPQMSFKSYHDSGNAARPACLTLSCPTNVIAVCTNRTGTVVTFPTSGATRCGSNVVVTCVPPSGSAFPPGVSVVDCSAIDSQGNQDRCRFTVTVTDNTPPSLVTPARVLAPCESPSGAAVTYSAAALDECDPSPVIVCRPPSGSVFPVGTTYVVCNAIDTAGNRSSVEFPILVSGGCGTNTCIALNLPGDITTNCNTTGGAIVSYTATGRDNCTGGIVPVTCVPPSGSVFPVGLTRVVCSTPAGPSQALAGFIVEVTDTVPPRVNCPSNLVVAAQSTLGAVVSYSVSATDDCTPASRIAQRCVPPSGSVFPVGTNHVTCEFADASGNRSRCSFDVTVLRPRPFTAIGLGASRVELRWVGDAVVETTDTLSDESVWSRVNATPQSNGVERVLILPVNAAQRFFRTISSPLLPPPDRDGDGVPDFRDRCPDSPAGLPVDEFGCSVFDIIGSPDLAFGPEQAQLRNLNRKFFNSAYLTSLINVMPNPEVLTCNVVVLTIERDLPHALLEQSNVVRKLNLALSEFSRLKAVRLAALARLAPILDAEHADVSEVDIELMQLETLETELTDSLLKNERVANSLANVVRSLGTTLPRQRVQIASVDAARHAITLTDGRRVLLPRPGTPGAPALESIFDAMAENSLVDLEVSRLDDGSYFGNTAQSAAGVNAGALVALDPRCLSLRVCPVDFGLPDFDFGTRHRLAAYRWGFTENLSHHFLEFGMAFAAVKINCATETPGAYKHWIQIDHDSDNNGTYKTLVTKLDENSKPFVLKKDSLPEFHVFNIRLREYRAPVGPNGIPGPSEVIHEEVQAIELNPPGTYAEAFYNRTVFDLEDSPNETGHEVAQVTDLGLSFPLTLKPLNEMSFAAASFKATGNSSSYPVVHDIGLNDPFAVHFQDPNEQLFFANPDDFDKGLYSPTLSGHNHGRPFYYRVRLPFIARDRLHDCGGGNSYGDPDTFYRIPFAGIYNVSQGNNGTFTHKGKQRYAFDFPKPAGTTVLAARGGVVVNLRKTSSQSCWNPNAVNSDGTTGACQNCSGSASANFVEIKHRDGTFGYYFHFKQNQVYVAMGQRVYRGTPLGGVGTTGCSTGNHTHFHVVTNDDDGTTIPIRFEVYRFPTVQFEPCYLPPKNSQDISTNVQP